jgi:tRNA(Ile)-lysidine synthase
MVNRQHKFLQKVKATISKHSMLSGGETVLVGLSGGPDSVCLLTALNMLKAELDLKLHAVYIDHGLRPTETPDETAFCRALCKGISVPFITKSIDVKRYAKEQGMNKQEAARELRYQVFHELLLGIQGDRISLGHTADDQVETFLMRLLRGSGPKGLSGMPSKRGKIIRPLIETERRDLEYFLNEQKIASITDSSNLEQDYLRNRIRHLIIPEMKRINPHFSETVLRTTEIVSEEEGYLELVVTKALMKLISRKTDSRIELFLSPLEVMEKVILRRVLRRAIDATRGLRGMEFIHIQGIMDLIREGKPGGRLYLPGGLRAIKHYATLVITSEIPQRIGAVALNVPGEAVLREIKVVITVSGEDAVESYGDGKTIAVFDADRTGNSLTVRPRERGDFFFPLGFGRRKKLQDYFVDEKVPRDERDSIPIVVSGNDIVWIAGYRGDERFKVTEETKRFLRLELKKAV